MPAWLRRFLTLLAVAVALGALVVAFRSGREEEPAVRVAGIVRVFPEAGAVGLRQDAVGAELATGYEGRLRVDDRDIPDDQVDRIDGINRLSFSPGPAKELETLAAGRHCATVLFRDPGLDPDGVFEPYSWCFTVA